MYMQRHICPNLSHLLHALLGTSKSPAVNPCQSFVCRSACHVEAAYRFMLLGVLIANATVLILVACDHLNKLVPHLKTVSHSFQYHNANKARHVDMLCNYMQEMLMEKDIQIAALQQELQLKCDAFTDCRTSQHSVEAAAIQTRQDLKLKLHSVKLQKTLAELQAKEAQQELEAVQKQLLVAEKLAADAEAGKRPLSQNSFV